MIYMEDDDHMRIRMNVNVFGAQVRRERISERMRLLQELVPGCNKVNECFTDLTSDLYVSCP